MQLPIVIIDTYEEKRFAQLAVNITLSCVDSRRVITFSDSPIISGEELIKIAPIKSLRQYSEFVLHALPSFLDTEHFLLIQWDGFAVNRTYWDDNFCSFDYIGAPWIDVPPSRNVGNGGFSLRSARLAQAVSKIPIHTSETLVDGDAEDVLICRYYRSYLECLGIKFADVSTAAKFSYENGAHPGESFGFHGSFNLPFFLRQDVLVDLHRELLAKTRNAQTIALFLYNSFVVGYSDLIGVIYDELSGTNEKLVADLKVIFSKLGMKIPPFSDREP